MKIFNIYIVGIMFLLMGCQSSHIFLKDQKTLGNMEKKYPIDFVFYDTLDNYYTISSFSNDIIKNNPNLKRINLNKIIIVEDTISNKYKNDLCVHHMDKNKIMKYCHQQSELSSLNDGAYENYIIIHISPNKHIHNEGYHTLPKVNNEFQKENKDFRISIITSDGKILKQSNEIIGRNELKQVLK